MDSADGGRVSYFVTERKYVWRVKPFTIVAPVYGLSVVVAMPNPADCDVWFEVYEQFDTGRKVPLVDLELRKVHSERVEFSDTEALGVAPLRHALAAGELRGVFEEGACFTLFLWALNHRDRGWARRWFPEWLTWWEKEETRWVAEKAALGVKP